MKRQERILKSIFYAHLSYGQASQIARGKKTENLQNGQNQGFLNTAPALIRQTRLFRYFRASLDPGRKTELLICRTSRPAPRKTPHPLKEGIGYKLTAGRRRSESLILHLLLLLFQIGTQLSPGGQWSEPAAPTFEFGNWKIKLVGVKTLHWTMTSIEPINTGKDSTWIFQILRSSYQSGCESRKHSNANLWEIRLR